MMIKDYLENYRDKSFAICPFNEIDNVLFCSLVAIDWEGIVSSLDKNIRLQDAAAIYFSKRGMLSLDKDTSVLTNVDNLKVMKDSLRYKDCLLSYYRNEVDDEKQFGALCIHFASSVYVAFKATDGSTIGWKEDFQMSYLFPIPSQECAIAYLNEVIHDEKTIYVGGHSKGGNLAMSAGMYCKDSIFKRIKIIFNNDGPGFKEEEFHSLEYIKMLTKLRLIIPDESVVGMLLYTPPVYKVVKSCVKGINQHDFNTWKCKNAHFESGTLSIFSLLLDEKITNWLDGYSNEERKILVDTLFGLLKENEITSLKELKTLDIKQVLHLLDDMNHIERSEKNLYKEALKNFIFTSR